MPTKDSDDARGAAEVAALAELAEAAAAEAEAKAAAASARAKAIRLRRQADEAESDTGVTGQEPKAPVEAGETEPDAAEAPEPDAAEATEPDAAARRDSDGAVEQHEPAPAWHRRLRLPKWGRLAVAALAIIATAGLVTVSVLMAVEHRNATHENQRRAEFAAAARQCVTNLMSIDFNKAKDDVQRILDSSTGDFKKDFQNTAPDFVKTSQDSKVVTKANVTAAAVQSIADNHDSGVVLVAAQSEVTNTAGAKDEQRNWRLSVTMTRDGGQLKMSKVEFIP